MTRVRQIVLPATLICLSAALPAQADPVTITTGFVDATLHSATRSAAGTASISGTDGFSVVATVSVGPGQGRLDALETCVLLPDCQPGYRLSQGAHLAPTDGLTAAVVSYGGVDYSEFGLTSPLSLLIELSGTATLPDFGDATSVTMTAPFALTGFFRDPDGGVDLPLNGSGTATLWLRSGSSFSIGEPGWTVERLRYDFEETAPVPEPSTLLLTAAGGLSALLRQRRSAKCRGAQSSGA
jgi:hypothetical protein